MRKSRNKDRIFLFTLCFLSIPLFIWDPFARATSDLRTFEGIEISDPSLETPLEPTIRLDLDWDISWVNVEPRFGADNSAFFHGTLYCQVPASMSATQTCNVFVTVDARGWIASYVQMYEFDYRNNNTYFQMTIFAPQGTSSSVMGGADISCRWEYYPGGMEGTQDLEDVTIFVLPYGGIILSQVGENRTAPVGDWTYVDFRVENIGNIDSQIELSISFMSNGMEAYVTPSDIFLYEGAQQLVRVKMRQKDGFPRINDVHLYAESDHEGPSSRSTYVIYYETTYAPKSFLNQPLFLLLMGASFLVLLVLLFIILRAVLKGKGRKGQ